MKIPTPELPEPQPRSQRRLSTIAQAAQADAKTTTPVTRAHSTADPGREPAPAPARRPARPTGASKDILLSLAGDLKARMESTIAFTAPYTGIKHQQVFIRRAIAELCARYEQEYNSGNSFPPVAEPEN